MSLERGTRHGAPLMDEPRDDGLRIAVAAVVVAVALLVAIALGVGALMPGAAPSPSLSPSPSTSPLPSPLTTSPSSSPEPSPSPQPSPSAKPSPTPEATTSPAPSATATARPTPPPTPRPTRTAQPTAMGADPADLPRFPGSRMERDRRGRSGDLATLELEYRTTARLDRVRRHYRAMLRRHDWVVGDVEFHGDTWDIEANRGTREAWIELKGDDDGTEVRIEVSWPAGDDPSGRGGPDGRGGSGGRGGNDDRSGPGG